MFSVWDLVEDQGSGLRGHVLATSADSDDFAATLADENPIISYRKSVQHLRKTFEDSDYQPPVGTVLITWKGKRFPELVLVSDVTLLNRQLLVGDLVVKASNEHQRGTVLKTTTRCTIRTTATFGTSANGPGVPAHFNTYEEIQASQGQLAKNDRQAPMRPGRGPREHWPSLEDSQNRLDTPRINQASIAAIQRTSLPVTFDNIDLFDLRTPTEYAKGDPILYCDWAGVIRSTLEEVTLRLLNNSVVTLTPGTILSQPAAQPAYSTYNHGDVVAVKKGDLRLGRWLFGAYDPNEEPVGVVVKIRPVEMAIDWQSNKKLDMANVGPGDIPAEIIGVDEIESGEYTFYDMQHFTAHPSKIGEEMEFTSDPDVGAMTGPRVRFFDIEEARKKYKERPEASRLFEQSRASNLGFDMNVYEVVDTRSTIKIQWQDGSITDELAIDVVYADFTEEDLYPGDIVCTRESQTSADNKYKVPTRVGIVQSVLADECIARIKWFRDPTLHLDPKEEFLALANYLLGGLQLETEDVSIYDLVVPWGLDIGFLDSVGYLPGAHNIEPLPGDPNGWLGHVLENHMDATYTIRLGASSQIRNVRTHIDQISLALDPERVAEKEMMDAGDMSDENGNPMSDAADDMDLDMDDMGDPGMIMMGDRQGAVEYLINGQPAKHDADNDDAWSTDEDTNEDTGEAMDVDKLNVPKAVTDFHMNLPPYAMLDGDVPAGHKFWEDRSRLTGPAIRKVMKEHAMLGGDKSMPSGIFVRSWESQCNLLRALIIGPSDTPYAHCPFVFDIMIPDDFPRKPPRVHFHHWTTGNFARNIKINPNLYEDGNVCLSLLNTWPGQEAEGWIPGQSTLLQVLISIQSLILVPEPFYNEPGYEGKRDIPGTGTQSVAYNERVLLQSHGFLQHALASVQNKIEDLSLEGLENVVCHIFTQETGHGMLKKAVEAGEKLIRKSRECDAQAMQKRDGISLISKGACQVLEKILNNLRAYLTVGEN
ncbi:putative ubiquitin-conjugating enzyme [Elsinoe fawcettii]|nr:putative ubiquitin-conjugating enzyme [Elsinoe fawcettii]